MTTAHLYDGKGGVEQYHNTMNFPQRKSPRRQDYDYTNSGAYFVTICTAGRQHYFGEIKHGNMILNELGKYCETFLQSLESQRSTVEIHEFIIMPNHVHILLLMSKFKSSMNKEYMDYRQDHRDTNPGIGCRDDLLGRPNIDDTGRPNNETIDFNNENGHTTDETENGHAKSMSLQPTYNSNYQGPTLGSIVNMFKGAVTKYAKSGIQIPYGDTFARQPRYHDHVIRNE